MRRCRSCGTRGLEDESVSPHHQYRRTTIQKPREVCQSQQGSCDGDGQTCQACNWSSLGVGPIATPQSTRVRPTEISPVGLNNVTSVREVAARSASQLNIPTTTQVGLPSDVLATYRAKPKRIPNRSMRPVSPIVITALRRPTSEFRMLPLGKLGKYLSLG